MKSINPAWSLIRAARKVRDFVLEMDYAQRRMLIGRLNADSYMKNPNSAPDTYAEFLMRTRAPLRHEPPAAARGVRPVS
jgi:hypothetical protein